MPSSKVLEAVAVTAELCGRTFSPAAAAVFVGDLDRFPEELILKALGRCRREVRGVLTVFDVISRIDDGRPGAEEAWAMLPRDESVTALWTDEMRAAWGIALPLLESGEDIPARMAFKEAYLREVSQARDSGVPTRWSVSLGHDRDGRAEVINAAVEKGLISSEHAKHLLPSPKQASPLGILIATGNPLPLLEATAPPNKENALKHIEAMKAALIGRVKA